MTISSAVSATATSIVFFGTVRIMMAFELQMLVFFFPG